ncbi:MAG: hypothetical protein JNM94_08475 [Phycisphaerae bacterium]|nr:hypothetical protein [Phycisphaerae bacterium]
MDQRANLESDVASELLTTMIDAAGAATGENMDQAREFVEYDEKGLAIGILLAMAADQDWQPDRATVE